MCLSLETLNHKDWLIYSVGTDMTGELCYTFSISNKLTQMVNFPTWIPGCFSVLLYWIYFFLLMLVFALPWFSFIGKLSSCCCLSFHWLFIKFTMGCPISSLGYDYCGTLSPNEDGESFFRASGGSAFSYGKWGGDSFVWEESQLGVSLGRLQYQFLAQLAKQDPSLQK